MFVTWWMPSSFMSPSGKILECSNTSSSGRLRPMPTDQYHEPPDELSAETRTFARMVTSLQEEAEAIGWYEQRISLERDEAARAIMQNAQQEEFKHFAMSLEWISRHNQKFRTALQNVLFKEGDIVELGEKAEEKVDEVADEEG